MGNRKWTVILVLLGMVLAVLMYRVMLACRFGYDATVLLVIAEDWGRGLLPFHTYIESKPLGMYLLDRLFLWMCGKSPYGLYASALGINLVLCLVPAIGFRKYLRPDGTDCHGGGPAGGRFPDGNAVPDHGAADGNFWRAGIYRGVQQPGAAPPHGEPGDGGGSATRDFIYVQAGGGILPGGADGGGGDGGASFSEFAAGLGWGVVRGHGGDDGGIFHPVRGGLPVGAAASGCCKRCCCKPCGLLSCCISHTTFFSPIFC